MALPTLFFANILLLIAAFGGNYNYLIVTSLTRLHKF